ncbi:MAG: respiratory nitrate reductase subunit gamma [Planctomycetes bacterium]|nr:respiratory nitrate reductase subunit gamma [Planctomycetota bacterium]
MDNFFFVALPYIAIVMFFGGIIYRGFSGMMSGYRGNWTWTARGDYLWSTRSTGFFGRASIGAASLCLHWGVLALFVAHVIGLIGGAFQLAAWVDFFRWVGLAGGILLLYGAVWALVRRVMIDEVRAMSRIDDYVVLVFLIAISGLGLYQSAVKHVFGIAFSAGPWLGGILTLQPDATAIASAPLVNRLHIILALLFFSYFPFTKLVHVVSYPFGYFTRGAISMRRFVALKR